MIQTASPIEFLAAFAIAFIVGILSGMGLLRYARYIREDARREFAPA